MREGQAGSPAGARRGESFVRGLGRAIWRARLLMTAASVLCLFLAVGALYLTAVDFLGFLGLLTRYGGADGAAQDALRTDLITDLVKILDGVLICAILVLTAFGLFELFVGKITDRPQGRSARLLRVRDLDDLKERVARLIVLVLMIELFGYALRIPYETPLDLVMFAGAVLLVALAVYLTRHASAGPGQGQGSRPETDQAGEPGRGDVPATRANSRS